MSKTKSLDASYNYAISQLFGSSLLKKIHDPIEERQIKNLLESCNLYPSNKEWNLLAALEISYKYLKKHYRCEYIYKNEIANQLLLKYHKDNSATLLKEVMSDTSIADIVIINGKTVAYEIKTELDSFERLPNQINSYKALYDNLYIVTHQGAVKSLLSKVDEAVGIIILTAKGQLKTVREAGANTHLFDPSKAVLTLRQSELVSAYEKYVGILPQMGTALIHSFCYKWFLELDKEDAHQVFYEALKSRRPSFHQFELIKQSSRSLKMLFLSKSFSKKYCIQTCEILSIFGY